MSVNLRSLIGKLNPTTRGVVEASAGLCLSRTHYDVEIEHFLTKALDATDGDLAVILKHYGINRSRLADDLARGLDRLKSGNARTPTLSPSLVKMLTEAWTLGSIEFGAPQARVGHCVLALVSNDELARMAKDVSREFEKIPADALKKDFVAITAPSTEASAEVGMSGGTSGSSQGAGGAAGGAPKAGGRTPNLDSYTVDLTARAKAGKIDPVLGRDVEIRQVIDILTRRRQNNPILVGEAGVGKTAVVEGFALRIVQGDVPEPLRNVTLRTLDLALLQAGAGVKGEFENRLKGLIDEVKNSPSPIILFIDEAHTMIGAGGAAGQNDAANLLKPALARGELRTIAATTWAEYKKYFEKDPALSRRFQLVKVEEPGEEQCLLMMRGVVPALEKHHKVRILDDGLDAAVRLSHRYLPDRQLPDKAVSVLDTACARLALGQQATPAAVEDARAPARRPRRADARARARDRARRRPRASGSARSRRGARRSRRSSTDSQARWEEESGLVAQIARRCATKLGGGARRSRTATAPRRRRPAALRAELGDAQRSSSTRMQGETPLMRVAVDASIVGEVISGWTGIPVGKMVRDQLSTMLQLEQQLGARVIGQDHALEVISQPHAHDRGEDRGPEQAEGRVHARRPVGRRQDRDRARAGRPAVRRRAEHDHDQHERVPGGAHGLHAQGLAAGLRRLRRRRRAHRGRAPPPVLGRAARRGREGAPGRARAVLPGVRQGRDGRRRGAGDRLQEHDHHPDDERRHGDDHDAHGGPGDDAERRRGWRRRSSRSSTRCSSRRSSGAWSSSRTSRCATRT